MLKTLRILEILKNKSKTNPKISLLDLSTEIGVSKERVRQIVTAQFNTMNKDFNFSLKNSGKLIFISDLKLPKNEDEKDLYLFLLTKASKYKINLEHDFLYSFNVDEDNCISIIYKRLKSNVFTSKLDKKDILLFLSKEFEIDEKTSLKLFNILVEEKYLEKFKSFYVFGKRTFKFLHEAVTYIITIKFNGYIDFSKDTMRLAKKVLEEFPEIFKAYSVSILSDRLPGLVAELKLFTLAGKSTYKLIEDFNTLETFETEFNFIENTILEKGIFSLFDYFVTKEGEYAEKGIHSLQEFYSLLRKKNTNSNICFLRYPSVSTKELANQFDDGVMIKQLYQLMRPSNLKYKDLQTYFGLAHSSFVQFFE